jgi:hypothetical protein
MAKTQNKKSKIQEEEITKKVKVNDAKSKKIV